MNPNQLATGLGIASRFECEMHMRYFPTSPMPLRSDKELAAKASGSTEGSLARDGVCNNLHRFEGRENKATIRDSIGESASAHRVKTVVVQQLAKGLEVAGRPLRPRYRLPADRAGLRPRSGFQPR